MTLSGTTMTVSNATRGTGQYCYKAGSFGISFEHRAKFSGTEVGSESEIMPMGIADYINPTMFSANSDPIFMAYMFTGGRIGVFMDDGAADGASLSGSGVITLDGTNYWGKLIRAATSQMLTYTDAYTTLHDTRSTANQGTTTMGYVNIGWTRGAASNSAESSIIVTDYDLQEAVGGWANDFNGVANANISEINGVAIASILEVNGVA